MHRIFGRLEAKMNDYNIKKKLTVLYICCVILPVFITDSIILTILLQEERNERNYEMANIASAVQSNLDHSFEEAVKVTTDVYRNRKINEFLEYEFISDLDYFEKSRELLIDSFYENSFGAISSHVVMYVDNDSIVNGGHFVKLAGVREQEWYQKYQASGHEMMVCYYYVGEQEPTAPFQKKISLIRGLHYFQNLEKEKLIKLDLDYGELTKRLDDMKYSAPVYVCSGDTILFSNNGHSGSTTDFDHLTGKERIAYEKRWSIYGQDIRILIMETPAKVMPVIWKNLPLILFMLAFNILFPNFFMYIINRSFTSRLRVLSDAFDGVAEEELKEIKHIEGTDEISSLMKNYNQMVRRSQELIKTVYKDRLERQEIDIARQNAELLALHSQINPHFLFNVLESIRMHCVLRKEEETAFMIEQLAVLERQNVNWSADMVRISEEIRFIEAYLELQKYRFGNRLTYQIAVEESCKEYVLPKLTLVTFVENACIHGVEEKTVPCWIDVRVYQKAEKLYLEIEDTGGGMHEETVQSLLGQMRYSTIDTLKENQHVGMVNACLRLRMVTQEQARFELESEPGIGTFMTIIVPVRALGVDAKKGEGADEAEGITGR